MEDPPPPPLPPRKQSQNPQVVTSIAEHKEEQPAPTPPPKLRGAHSKYELSPAHSIRPSSPTRRPDRSTTPSRVEASNHPLPPAMPTDDLTKIPFYHNVGKQEANELLRPYMATPGHYLLRPSSDRRALCAITVTIKNNSLQYRVYRKDALGFFIFPKQFFHSLAELLDFYKATPLHASTNARLLSPVLSSEPVYHKRLERSIPGYYPQGTKVDKYMSENLLIDGNYLMTPCESSSSKTLLTLGVSYAGEAIYSTITQEVCSDGRSDFFISPDQKFSSLESLLLAYKTSPLPGTEKVCLLNPIDDYMQTEDIDAVVNEMDKISQSTSQSKAINSESDSEEEFIRKINEAFKCGEKIARRLAHAMLVGPPGSGKSSLMDRLLHRKRRKFTTSTNVAETVVTVEVRLDEKKSTFHAAIVMDGVWKEFEFDDSLISHMSLKSSRSQVNPSQLSNNHSVQTDRAPKLQAVSIEDDKKSKHFEVGLQPESANDDFQNGKLVATCSLSGQMVSYLKKKHGNYKRFKHFLEGGFSLYLRDTGGQVEFQEILPLLIFGPSIFLFVFRLDLPFKMKFEVKYRQKDGAFNDYISSITIEEALLQCLATVDIMKRSEKASTETRDPYVFIVGTHRDKLLKKLKQIKNGPSLDEEIRNLNISLDALLKKHSFNDLVSYAGNDPEHVMYTVDNTAEDETDFDLIRSRINAVITSRKEFVINYPINYLLFCLDLQKVGDNILYLKDFKERAKKFGIVGNGEVSKLLYFLSNRIGIIQHFDKEGVSHIIINQPQFLYKEVSSLIIETFKGKTLSAAERVELEKGMLSHEAAESIIGTESKITTSELLDLLTHLRIIAQCKDGKYFIPCVLNHLPQASDQDLAQDESIVAPLYIQFGRRYCPKGLFGVLVTYLMSSEETLSASLSLELMKEGVSKDQVSFEVESGDEALDLLTIKVVACSFLEVSLIPEERDHHEIVDVCNSLRKLFETCLTKSFQDLHYNEEIVKYEMCLRCEQCSDYHKVLHANKLRCGRRRVSAPQEGRYWFRESATEIMAASHSYPSRPTPSSHSPKKLATAASGFGEDMTPEELCSYLASKKMPQKDCTKIKEQEIGGVVFLYFSDDDWKEFGISKVGLMYIRRIKEKIMNDLPQCTNSRRNLAGISSMKRFRPSEEDANRRISDIHMAEISQSYCKHWKLLAPYLGMKEIDVSDVERVGSSELEKRQTFFGLWRERKGSEATYQVLIDALFKIRCRDDAENVYKILNHSF